MSSVLFPQTLPSRTPKLHVSASSLPPYVDPKEPPTKKPPWRQINETPFVKTVTLTMPSTLHDQIWSKIEDNGKKDGQNNHQLTRPRYAKVFMKLEDILTGEFFNTYIKIGDILMISDGIPGVDSTTATLRDGTLKLEVNKDIYQRCGIQGQPVKNHGARKHVKERFMIEMNLRLPSMVRGKKGFDRLLYAAKNVLNENRIWLFCDLMPGLITRPHHNEQDQHQHQHQHQHQDSVLAKYHPTIVTDGPHVSEVESVVVPALISRSQQSNTVLPVQDHEHYYEMVEWLDLVNLESARVRTDDKPDPYISRYAPPLDANLSATGDDGSLHAAETLRLSRWKGLISSSWVTRLLIELVKQARAAKSEQWLAVMVKSHPTVALGGVDGYTVLLRPLAKSSETDDEEDRMKIDQSTQATSESDVVTRNSLRDVHCFQFVDTTTG